MKNLLKQIFTKKTKLWVKSAMVRAIKTFAQTFTSLITVGAAVSEINWGYVASVSFVSFVYSIVTSLGGLPEVKEKEEVEE